MEDDYLPLNSIKMRIVMTSWILAIVVLVNSYSSQLVSFLTVPVYEKTVETFDDLVKRPDLPLTIPANSVFLQRIMVNENAWLMNLI